VAFACPVIAEESLALPSQDVRACPCVRPK
jgi:hypothetical protein